ncbi:vitellin-degrading protease-like [Achroia grisella]|uniref:vitellin-degrading protease-like n=1 Tax=Achroia grisella TaxID=688607 RepID=UPI0027D2ACA1|nr:vitellin-degrading protease-like [Achroia grisella]
MYKFMLGVAVFGFVASAPTLKNIENVRIVGGEDIEISDAPYQASVIHYNRHVCGGTIIARDIIITAAHCMMVPDIEQYTVRVGSSYSTHGGDIYQVGDVARHPGFSFNKMDNDIAVIWLSTPIIFNENVSSIDLFEHDEELEDGELATITGWGDTAEGGGHPDILQRALVPKVNNEKCHLAYAPEYTITSNMLCAGYPEGGKDACQGDSGGPLMYNNKLAAVVSWGIGCARPDYPGVYAKVSAFRGWLDEKITYLRIKNVLRGLPYAIYE